MTADLSVLVPGLTPARPTLAKIVATLGPASDAPETLAKLVAAGVSVFRLNFSHGEPDEHLARLGRVRAVAAEMDMPVAVLGDLPGPKIRLGRIAAPGMDVVVGRDVVLVGTAGDLSGVTPPRDDAPMLPCNYEPLAREVSPGHRVLINDGAVRLLAMPAMPGDPEQGLRCRVTVGGLVTSRKGVNLPDSDISAPALTDRDWKWVHWAVEHGLDFLALSFVRKAEEVIRLRDALAGMCPVDSAMAQDGAGARIPVIAKIEKPQALANIDAILEATDAIMVARGDLGVEMDTASVPVAQKRLIAKADEWGKPCIVATQMLETMIESATPTRAEASDVANAIFDGADAVMLSGETAVGKHPVLVVETMRRIITAAEERLCELRLKPTPPARVIATRYRTAALAHGAWHVAEDGGAKLVAVWSQKGGAARHLSQTGFRIPIVAYSSDERATRRMALLKGVTPICARPPESGLLSDWNRRVDEDLLLRGWAEPGDAIVLLAGKPLGEQGAANTISIHYVGQASSGYMRQ